MNQHLENHTNYRFMMYTSNYQVNSQSNDQLDVPFLNTDFHFTFKPVHKYKSVDIFVESTNVETNNDIYFSNDITEQEYPLLKLDNMREDTDSNVDSKFGYGSYYFRKS